MSVINSWEVKKDFHPTEVDFKVSLCGETITKILLTEGVVIINNFIEDFDYEGSVKRLIDFSGSMGKIVENNRRIISNYNTLYTDIKAREGGPRRISNQEDECLFHTDIVDEKIPEFVIMACLNPAVEGGETLLCNMYDCFNYLNEEESETLAILENESFYCDTKSKSKLLSQYRSFHCDNDSFWGILQPYSIMKSTRFIGGAYAERMKKVIQLINSFASNAAKKIILKKGQAILFNNLQIAHARKSFTSKENSPRHLIRVLFNKSLDLELNQLAVTA